MFLMLWAKLNILGTAKFRALFHCLCVKEQMINEQSGRFGYDLLIFKYLLIDRDLSRF